MFEILRKAWPSADSAAHMQRELSALIIISDNVGGEYLRICQQHLSVDLIIENMQMLISAYCALYWTGVFLRV